MNALESREHTFLVALGLQPSDEPGADVGEPLVVEIHRVLSRQHDADTVRAGLFEQRQQGLLGRRFRHRRHVAEDLVHVEQRPKAGRTGPRSHPRKSLIEQQRHEEHPLGIGQVGDREHRDPGLARGGIENLLQVEGLPLHPPLKARSCQQVVDSHGELETILRGKEGIELHNAHLLHRWALNRPDQAAQIEATSLGPEIAENGRKQDVLAALDRVGVDAQEAEQAGGRCRDPIAKQIALVSDRLRGRGKRRQNRNRPARVTARSVDRELRRVLQPLDAFTRLAVPSEALLPECSLLGGEFIRRKVLAQCVVLVDPGAEILGRQTRKGEQEIAQISLRIDDDGGNSVQGSLFEQADAQPGLAAARHAHAHGVGHEILRVIEQKLLLLLALLEIVVLAEVEAPQLFIVLHMIPRYPSVVLDTTRPAGRQTGRT